MKKPIKVFILLLLLSSSALFSQNFEQDLIAENTLKESNESYIFLKSNTFLNQMKDSAYITKKKWYKTDTGLSLLVAGTLIGIGTYIHLDDSFKVQLNDEINRYLPDFNDPIDDYLQYIPYAAVYALDIAGIKSKHNTKRKTTTMATAIALNLVAIQGLKYSIAEPRPSGSANNSFPSGHTATAFMGAHIFHKEYGHKSPFYSIGGYVLATMTGVLRQLNNHHWVSDVFVGAGLGIGVTELAYFLNNNWWGEKGIIEYEPTIRKINNLKPSFIGFKVGYASLIDRSNKNEPANSSETGFRISSEGAYFFNKYFGIGGEIGFQSFPNSIDSDVELEFNNLGYEILPESSGNTMYYAGGYFQYPFGKNALGTKLLLGAISGPNTKVFIRELSQNLPDEDEFPEDILYADYEPSTTFSWATGVQYTRVLNDNMAMKFYVDYNNADLKYSVSYLDPESIDNGPLIYSPRVNKITNWDSYSFGISVDIMLW